MRTRAGVSLAACLSRFAAASRPAFSAKTVSSALWQIERFLAHLAPLRIASPRRVTPAHIVGYLATFDGLSRRGRPYSPVTVSTALGVLRGFFSFLERQGVILQNPTLGIDLPRAVTLPRVVLTERQARRLMAQPLGATPFALRNRAILEVLYGTGLRASECARLDLSDVDIARGMLLVRSGKGRVDRVVPLSGRARVAVASYLQGGRPQLARKVREGALFLSQRGRGRLTVFGIQVVVVRAAQAAGIPFRCGPHALRHTCATHLVKGGADVRYVQRILGHKDLRSTQVYTRVSRADLLRMIDRCHPRGRRSKASRVARMRKSKSLAAS